MALVPRYDPLLDDLVDDSVPQLDADPSSPIAEQRWVLHTTSGGGGSGGGVMRIPLAGGGAITSVASGGSTTHTYQFSYRTKEGTTKRTTLS